MLQKIYKHSFSSPIFAEVSMCIFLKMIIITPSIDKELTNGQSSAITRKRVNGP